MQTQDQNIQSKKIPKLRFLEFSEMWEEKRLGQLSDTAKYGINAPATKFDGKNIYLRITDIDEFTGLLKKLL